jgi:hypothetical protein
MKNKIVDTVFFLSMTVMVVIGAFAISYSIGLPEFKPGMPLPDDLTPWDADGHLLPDRDSYTKEFHERTAAASTGKWRLLHTGESLIVLSFCLAFIRMCIGNIGSATKSLWQRLFEITTPRHWLIILGLGAVTMAYEIPWTYYYYSRIVGEGCCPVWADSLGVVFWTVIPFVQFLLIVLLPIGYFMFLFKSKLPVPILVWNKQHPQASLIYTLIVLPFLLFLMVLCIPGYTDAWKIPQALLGVYVVLCSRAAAISRYSTV